MKIYLRSDASVKIGTGHVIRCLTLADELAKRKAEVYFICKELPGHLCNFIENRGYKVFRLPQGRFEKIAWKSDAEQAKDIVKKNGGCDCTIIDHYGIDERWEKLIRKVTKAIMVIDDLANRNHDCDMLLDQNYCRNHKSRYNGLVLGHSIKMLGPEFALLRPEFAKAKMKIKARNGQIKKILVSFGGSDPRNETCKTLEAIASFKLPSIKVGVIAGMNNPHLTLIEKLVAAIPQEAECSLNVKNMSRFMSEADLYIGAPGGSIWECFCLGLPSLIIATSGNQVEIVKYLSRRKILHYIGRDIQVKAEDIKDTLGYFLKRPSLLMKYSNVSFGLVDGLGAGRCADIIVNRLG